jgi:hypothetical protein
VEFLESDVTRFNELLFSDNIYEVRHVSLVSDDVAYVVYKNLFCKPNPKGNIFVAAFTTAHARIHLYDAVRKLDRRVVYMDTDSVVFNQSPGMWTPRLSSYLGDWTDEIPTGWQITDFTTCGPKNYSYTMKNLATGEVRDVLKVKGLRLSKQAADLLDARVLQNQVEIFTSRSRSDEVEGCPPAKRQCLVSVQKKGNDARTRHINDIFLQHGAQSCVADVPEQSIPHGACNCRVCSTKTSVTVPQVRFRKHRREGYVETADVRKEYQLVLNKRWLLREYHGRALPFRHLTLPFGFVKLTKKSL